MDALVIAVVGLAFLGAGLGIGLLLRRTAVRDAERNRELLASGQAGMQALLGPVVERLQSFEARVERTHAEDGRDRARLLETLRHLQEAQRRLHDDAESLARALTGDSKAQGDWGEVILERVLETAGLAEGREYELQAHHVDADGGRKRPDAIVRLPGGRVVVVDAKCSLTAFVAATRAADDEEREEALDAHVASLRAHVRGLAGKDYPEAVGPGTLDLVLLLVPSEAAFQAAVARAPGLHEEAFRQRIVVCSPTTLLAALHLVAHLWRTERQDQNAREIALEAGRLLEKLAAFVADLDEVGERIEQAGRAHREARAKLATGRGNVLAKARKIVDLGAPAKGERVRQLLDEAGEDHGEEGPPPAG